MSGYVLEIDATWDGQMARPDEAVQLCVEIDGDDLVIDVDAPFHGDPPPAAPPGATDGLWNHEVVELFVASEVGPKYLEIELGPHGHHLVLQLDGIRTVVARGLAIAFTSRIAGDRWTGQARVPRAWLPPSPHRVNAYAIHGEGEARRYLALAAVPGEKPDFHQPAHFVALSLDPTLPG